MELPNTSGNYTAGSNISLAKPVCVKTTLQLPNQVIRKLPFHTQQKTASVAREHISLLSQELLFNEWALSSLEHNWKRSCFVTINQWFLSLSVQKRH